MLQNTSSATQRLSGKYVELTRDLDFNSIFSYNNYKATYKFTNNSTLVAYEPDQTSETTLMELITNKEGLGFIPIGKINGSGVCIGFMGTFDGKNHQISNLYINSTSEAGLFKGANSATIKNITVDGYIKGTGSVGGISGASAAVKYCSCINKAEIIGGSYNGGIVGRDIVSGVRIEKCYNEGNAICGICGEISGIVSKSANLADLNNGTSGIGSASRIINCYNLGNIGSENKGAARGIGTCSKIFNCYNKGELTANPTKISQYGGPARNRRRSKWRTNIQLLQLWKIAFNR
jgi:hypothetical protein